MRITCLATVERYLASLSKGTQPTKKGYMAFAAEHGLLSMAASTTTADSRY
jgi:hypothetical protein